GPPRGGSWWGRAAPPSRRPRAARRGIEPSDVSYLLEYPSGAGVSLRLEAVPDALHRRDAPAGSAELGAQSAHVHVDGARLDLVGARVAPDAVQQELAREHAPRGPHQGVQQVELLRRELHGDAGDRQDRKSTRLNSSHVSISYAVFCLKKKKKTNI